jgi:peptide/nickel transport system permease protein
MGAHRLAFVSRRLIQLIPVVLAIASFNFVLIHLAPGDAADIIAGQGGYSTPEYIAELRREFGLDKPLYQQYFIYIGRVLSMDLGFSPVQQKPVIDLILERLPATVILVFSAVAMSVGFGILLGIISATRRGSITDTLVTIVALLFYATPAFWFGLMLIIFFSLKLDLLPSGGMETIASGKIGLAHVVDVTKHLILPSITMALYYLAIYTRLMRASMLEVLNLDFVRTARAKGLSERSVAWKHAARNALLPVVTIAGLQIGHFMGGSVLVETIFGWPGLGRLVFDSLAQRDANLLMGIFLVSSILVVLVNLLADLTYGFLDPRISHK